MQIVYIMDSPRPPFVSSGCALEAIPVHSLLTRTVQELPVLYRLASDVLDLVMMWQVLHGGSRQTPASA